MSRLFLTISFLIYWGWTYGIVPTPSPVQLFYNGMDRLSNVYDENAAKDISISMKKCFVAHDYSGINLPNDFYFFDYDKKSISHTDRIQNSSNYIDKLVAYIFRDKVMKVNIRIKESEYIGNRPDYKKGRLVISEYLVATYVEKVFEINGFRKTFNDTVLTEYNKNIISEIRNGYGKAEININSLRNEAGKAYRYGNYYQAYKCYEKIVSVSPKDADALFRLGLMSFFQHKECGVLKSNYRAIAIDYLEKASLCADNEDIRRKADNALHRIKYPNM